MHTVWHVALHYSNRVLIHPIGIGASPAGPVLAGPLLFKVKIKFHFYKKQAMN